MSVDPVNHPLRRPVVLEAITRAASGHAGRPWAAQGFTDLDDRASHPCGVLHGRPFPVFAKLDSAPDAAAKFTAEMRGLDLVERLAGIATPTPVGPGVVPVEDGWLLLFEALPERHAEDRTRDDWRSIGHTLARLHTVHSAQFGLDGQDGFFGPFRQDNTPVPANRWADFYAERRVRPLLRSAVGSGYLPADLAGAVERLVPRLAELSGAEPRPSLVHGDAQQNNFVSTPAGAVVVDVAPYFGHPEIDLALVDHFAPVPPDVFDAYREIRPIDPDFPARRELWRLFAYLAAVTVDGTSPFGRRYLGRLSAAVAHYTSVLGSQR